MKKAAAVIVAAFSVFEVPGPTTPAVSPHPNPLLKKGEGAYTYF